MSKLYLSAGHGGKDPGAVKGDRLEKNYTLIIANKAAALLKAAGHEVIQNRTADTDSKLADKTRQANREQVDAVAEIHLNAGGGTGCEVYYSIAGGEGKRLAESICGEISKLGFRNRGAKTKTNFLGRDYFAIIRDTKAPAVLIECCFLDNGEDMKRLDCDAMARAVAGGILLRFPTNGRTPSEPAPAVKGPYQTGDEVLFKGGYHYKTSNSPDHTGNKRRKGKARITKIMNGGRHPYHLIGIDSNVYGWVDTASFE